MQKKTGWTRLFFCDQAALKRCSRLKNQSASIDATGTAGFFPVSEHPKGEKKSGGLGVNKRSRGYPADFEFIERHLKKPFGGSVVHQTIIGTALRGWDGDFPDCLRILTSEEQNLPHRR